MWRSIATRSGNAVRRVGKTNNYKVSSFKTTTLSQSQKNPPLYTCILSKPSHLYRHHRYLSDASANPTDDTSISTESECSSPGFEQNGGTQVSHFTYASEDSGMFDHSSEDFCENNEIQLENFAYANVIPEIAERSSIDSGEIDMDLLHGISDHTPVGFDGGDMQVEGVGAEAEAFEIDVEKLGNVLSLLQSSVCGSLESNLNGMDLYLDEKFVVKVLETPLLLGENVIRFFKWAMKKPEFKVTSCVVDFLVRAICSDLRKKDSYAMWDLVKEIGEKGSGVLNVEILNKLISLFSRLGKGKAALEVFNKFEDFGCVPDEKTYYFTIEALCRRSFFDWAVSVCEKMLDAEALPDSEKIGKIIYWFCKGGKAKNAHLVYMLEKEKNKYPRQSSINYLISSLCQKDETIKLALEMLDDFSGEARKYAIKPFSSVIHGLCRIKDVDGAKFLLHRMIAEGPPPGNEVFNRIITGYSKFGDMKEAMKMIKLMESRNLKPDVYTYTVVISGYANGGQMEEAIEVLSEAKKKHTKLSPATYHTLIRGYCKVEEFDSALKLISEMKDFGVQPKVDEYNKLIQSLCLKALDWRSAEKLLEEMKENDLYLNGITKGLIRAVKELEEETLANEEASRALSD